MFGFLFYHVQEKPLQTSEGVHVDQNPPASERMWDGEAPGPFRRGCQTRASLPAGHWSSHQAERPLGMWKDNCTQLLQEHKHVN